jgi:hypothetical protein
MSDDDQIDAAIDETARQMTAGEPSADFRALVMARIEAGSEFTSRGHAFGTWRPALAGLTVAVLVIGLAVSRDRQRPANRLASARASIVRLPGPDATSKLSTTPIRDDQPQVRLKPDATYQRRALDRATRGSVHDVESLELPSIDLDSIAVAALAAGDSIDIEPLPPAPSIAVTPLDVENQGDRR